MILRLLLTASMAAGILLTSNAQRIEAGSPAPALFIKQWIKGEPVPELKKGNVYVVEFSSVNCPPCRKAIPHLSELAKQYANELQVISIYTNESNPEDTLDLQYLANIKKMVRTLQDKIDFTVAADVPQQSTGLAWGITGTPEAFLIDRSGHIVWRGGNARSLDALIPQVLNNTLNVSVVKQEQEAFDKILKHASAIKDSGQYLRSVEILDSLMEVRPEYRQLLYWYKFDAFASRDDKRANELLRWMLQQPLPGFVWDKFLIHTWVYPKQPDYDLVLQTADRAIAEAETDVVLTYILMEKAQILRRRYSVDSNVAHLASAVEVMKLAMEKSKSAKEEELIQYVRKTLDSFEFVHLAVAKEKEAIRYLKKLLKRKQGDIDCRVLIDDALEFQKSPDYNVLLAVSDRMIKEAGENMSLRRFAFSRRGKVLAAMGEREQAIGWFERALELEKDGYYRAGLEKVIEGLKAGR